MTQPAKNLESRPEQPTKSLAEIQDEIVAEFESLKDWDERYKHIIDLGRKLPKFPEEHRVEKNMVKGCQSQVWMVADLADDGRVYFQADSDAMIVRGLIALLLRLYSGHAPDEILSARPEFVERINMSQHISMTRSNGLFAMIKQIQLYALAFKMKQQQG